MNKQNKRIKLWGWLVETLTPPPRLKGIDMTDRDKYFDLLVIRIVSGDENSQWSKLVDFLMSADDVNYAKVARAYPELINAINRYNESHKGFVETKLQRKGK